MDVLVTGGAGFIGSRLCRRLVSEGREVVIFDSLHPQVHTATGFPRDVPAGVTLFMGDVTDPAAWDRVFRTYGLPSVLVHLAAETGTGQSLREATRHSSANVVGTTAMTDALARNNHAPDHLLLSSSRAVYGEGAWQSSGTVFYPGSRSESDLKSGLWDPRFHGDPATHLPHRAEDTWAQPTNVYAATKLAQEHVLAAWCSSFSVPLSILRLQNVYGPGQSVGNSYTGVLTFFARSLSEGIPVHVYEDGNIVRDFVFVDDVVSAFVSAMKSPPTGSFRRLDIGGGEACSLLVVAEKMAKFVGAPTPKVTGQYRSGDVRCAEADLEAVRAELAWSPATSLDDGLQQLLTWVPTQL